MCYVGSFLGSVDGKEYESVFFNNVKGDEIVQLWDPYGHQRLQSLGIIPFI